MIKKTPANKAGVLHFTTSGRKEPLNAENVCTIRFPGPPFPAIDPAPFVTSSLFLHSPLAVFTPTLHRPCVSNHIGPAIPPFPGCNRMILKDIIVFLFRAKVLFSLRIVQLSIRSSGPTAKRRENPVPIPTAPTTGGCEDRSSMRRCGTGCERVPVGALWRALPVCWRKRV